MDTKLTLTLDTKIIEKAKSYARKKNTSLSKLVEVYLQFINSKVENEGNEITPLVKSLSGILEDSTVSESKSTYKKHLGKKYGG